MKLCSNCGLEPVVAGGLGRRCFDAQPARRAARQAWQRSQVSWRRDGLTVDPFEGWEGVHGIAVRSRVGVCAYRRPSRTALGAYDVRRPGHPLAGKQGWVSEPRMWIYDEVARTGAALICQWCRTPLAWTGRVGKLVAHPAQLDPKIGWDDLNVAPACWICTSVQRYGIDATTKRLDGGGRWRG